MVALAALCAVLLVRTWVAPSRLEPVLPASRSAQVAAEPSALTEEAVAREVAGRAAPASAAERAVVAAESRPEPTGRIAGRVVDVHTGFAVAGATLRIALGEARASCVTADDGAFETEELALPEGPATATFQVTTALEEGFELEAAAEGAQWRALRLEVEASYEVRGVLVDAADRPVEGVVALIERSTTSGRAAWSAAATDTSGAFELRFPTTVPIDRTTLLLSGESAVPREQPISLDRLRVDLGRLRLDDGATITGRVVRTYDRAWPGTVTAIATGDGGGSADPVLFAAGITFRRNRDRVYRAHVHAPIGPEGAFEIRGLLPGPYALRLNRDACDFTRGLDEVRVEAPARDVEIVDAGAVLVVDVADSRGAALDLARLHLRDEPEFPCRSERGRIEITLPPGEIEATVVCPGFLPFELRLVLDAGTIHHTSVVLAGENATGELVVSVVDTEGRTPPQAEISVLWRADPESELVSVHSQITALTEEGVALPDIPAGELLVRANPNTLVDDYGELALAAERTVELEPHGTERVELVCGVGGHVRVDVRNPGGEVVTARLRWIGQDPTFATDFLPDDRWAIYRGFNGGAVLPHEGPHAPRHLAARGVRRRASHRHAGRDRRGARDGRGRARAGTRGRVSLCLPYCAKAAQRGQSQPATAQVSSSGVSSSSA